MYLCSFYTFKVVICSSSSSSLLDSSDMQEINYS